MKTDSEPSSTGETSNFALLQLILRLIPIYGIWFNPCLQGAKLAFVCSIVPGVYVRQLTL